MKIEFRSLVVAHLLAAVVFAPRPAAAQGTLEKFSYDSLGFHGVQAEVGALFSSKLETAAVFGLRLHFGEIASRVRFMAGFSYFKDDLDRAELARLEQGIIQVVDDPSGTATVDLGRVRWSDLTFMGDFQYLIVKGHRWMPYIGAGMSVHFRNGSGPRIAGTVIEDNLDQVQIGLDATAGTDIMLTRSLVLNAGLRGVLTGSLNTLTLGVGLGYRLP